MSVQALCKESMQDWLKCFALDLKARYLFSGFTALPSASSHQYTPQLAHGKPDTKQRASQITKVGMRWTCIYGIGRAALSLALREANRSERQQACGHRLRCGCNTPSKICSNVNCEHCRKISRKGNNAVLPVGAVPAAPRQQSAPSVLLACTVTAGGKENMRSAIANAQVLGVIPMTAVSEWP